MGALSDRPVMLVHGVLTNGMEMTLLRRRLRRQGFAPRQFSYHSRHLTVAENARVLADALADWRDQAVVDFVAYSLGGLVLARFFAQQAWPVPGRVVLLGVPLRGSEVAAELARRRFGRWLLGQSLTDGLLGGTPAWPRQRETLMIAGRLPYGLGYVATLGRLRGPSDGVVRVAETDDPTIIYRQVLPVTHSSLLLSSRVAWATGQFLREGTVVPDSAA